MNRRIAVRAIVVHEGKLLCVRLQPSEYAPKNGTFWCVPGGGLDDNEDLKTGLEREMIEELGIKPQIGNLLYIQQYGDDIQEYLEFLFEVTNAEDYLHVDLSKTTHGVEEIAEIGFFDPSAIDLYPRSLMTCDLQKALHTGVTNIYTSL